ncbi:MAG: hypothetical protein N2544_04710, partial [Burkholderiales bacterium]|nr:hypothetical protein [Burkholderiales bacterium]
RLAIVNTSWNGNRGAITFGDPVAGLPVGAISNANSIIGTAANDYVGGGGLVPLAGASAAVVIGSPSWNASRGAATFVPLGGAVATPGDGTIAPIAGTFGDVSASNSL